MTPVRTASPADLLAAALADALPGPGGLTAGPAAAPVAVPAGAVAVTATFVGARSADLTLVLADGALVAEASDPDGPRLTAGDVLRPALEAAAAPLGAGVLGEPRELAASTALDAPGAELYALRVGDTAVAWLAVELRAESPAPSAGGFDQRLGRISDVAMELTVEIGRTRMSVRDLLGLEPGAVVELDRSVGSPADILLNGRLIAHGEVVVVDQDYAVRVTRILDTETAAL